MPIYDYRCEKGHRFEVFQSMAADALTSCEQCSAPAQRVLHAPAIHFKGSGFHNTDYGTKKRPKDGDTSSGGESSSVGTSSESSNGSGSGEAKGTKEATKADTVARAVGP